MTRPVLGRPFQDICCRGHELIQSNVYVITDKDGYEHRHCRTCRALHSTYNQPRSGLYVGSLDNPVRISTQTFERTHKIPQGRNLGILKLSGPPEIE